MLIPMKKFVHGCGCTDYYDDDGNLHREDGPARVDSGLCQYSDVWYWHGKMLDCKTQEEFLQLIKMKAFW